MLLLLCRVERRALLRAAMSGAARYSDALLRDGAGAVPAARAAR